MYAVHELAMLQTLRSSVVVLRTWPPLLLTRAAASLSGKEGDLRLGRRSPSLPFVESENHLVDHDSSVSALSTFLSEGFLL